MDNLIQELNQRIKQTELEVRRSNETIHAHECLLAFQEESLDELSTTLAVVLKIQSEITEYVQLGEDRDH